MAKISSKNENSHIPEPSGVLLDKIMEGIRKEKKFRQTRRRVVLFSIGLVLSLSAIVPAYDLFLGQIAQTGFGDFISLIWSDYEIIINYWGVFSLALLESFPVAESVVFLTVIFLVLGSFGFLAREAKKMFGQLNNGVKSFN
jgi:hypothetical protein